MKFRLILQPKVKPSTQPPSLPPDFLERYRHWLIQRGLGHKDVSTTMIYTHVLNRGGVVCGSPLDLALGAMS